MKKLMICLFIGFIAGCVPTDTPLSEKELTLIVPSSPNGGWDALATSIKTVIEKEKLVNGNVNIVYEEGNGGEQGWLRLNESSSSTVAMTSSLLLTNELLGHSKLHYEEFTPLATMASEWQAIVVSNHSSITSIQDLMHKLKMEPAQYPIGIEIQFGNDDQISFIQAARTQQIAAATLRFFQYANSNDLLQALNSGEIVAASLSSSQSAVLAENKQIRIIGISSPKRLEQLPTIPTWREEGVDVVFPHWRGVMGTGEMNDEEREQWSQLLAKVQASPIWEEELQKNNWTAFYKNSEETMIFLDKEYQKYRYTMKLK
ncbi:tripartite tricarboxylate transporter substrate-binding protein [Lysinibacillus piscis]|uniref:UPF0065 protein YflP n=1 Tax=Lysinibacillus piscis TaxID=2518931 RepID=A0ABQ5NPE8_9BACI|nr:tripartite tricarboxylate transporter substrate-binding protein [Lysinibacillus sp. KH24]GLC90219.1 UPF0065 protein YflP [Lysinibacillus sp. KH24]